MLEVLQKYKLKYIILVFVLYFAFYNLYVMYSNKFEEVRRPSTSTYFSKRSSDTVKYDKKDFYYDNSLLMMQGPFKFGKKTKNSISLFPHESDGNLTDRIINQMRYFHPKFNKQNDMKKEKLIFVEDDYPVKVDISMCPIGMWCRFLFDNSEMVKADLILLRSFSVDPSRFLPKQIIVPFLLESPLHFDFKFRPLFPIRFNWSATYRYDSTIVTPYYKFTPFDLTNPDLPISEMRFSYPKIDYSKNRSKQIVWFVSNCQTDNERLSLANMLARHFQVDIYGACGKLKCPRTQEDECLAMLKNYMFYLSFENSNCRHYITEKFFKNALNSSIVPIVFGAPSEDYKLVAPPHSYIHVEDFSNFTHLVRYLKYLMKNSTAYNEYFSWRGHGTVDTNTFFWCRLCTMAHYADDVEPNNKTDTKQWWDKSHSCVTKSWNIKAYW